MQSRFDRFNTPPRAQIMDVLVAEHQNFILKQLGSVGIVAKSWVELSEDDITSFYSRKASFSLTLNFGDSNDPYRSFMLGERILDDEQPIYPISIFGSDGIQIINSDIPSEYDAVKFDNTTSLREQYSDRARYIHCQLVMAGKGKREPVRIYMAPDVPPVAVHLDDVRYLHNLAGAVFPSIRAYYHQDYADIDAVESAFGQDAVEYLSDQVCLQLMSAIVESNKQAVHDTSNDANAAVNK